MLILATWVRLPDVPTRPLWGDEAWRALMVAYSPTPASVIPTGRTLGRQIHFGEWATGTLGRALVGDETLAVRLFPALFSISAIVAAFCVGRRLAGSEAGLAAAVLVALGPSFVFHARAFKPYPIDLALSLWTAFFALRYASSPTRAAYGSFVLCLSFLAAFSYVFPFVSAGLLAALLLGHPSRWPRLLGAGLLGTATFAAHYAFFVNPQGTPGLTDYMRSYWQEAFLDPAHLGSLGRQWTLDMESHFLLPWYVPTALLVVAVAWGIARRDPRIGILGIPIALQAIVSHWERYPLLDRPTHYWYGFVAVALGCVASGGLRLALGRLGDASRVPAHRVLTLLLVGAAAIVFVTADASVRAREYPVDVGTRSLPLLRERMRGGDALFVSFSMDYAFLYYRETRFSNVPAFAGHGLEEVMGRFRLSDGTRLELCRSVQRIAKELGGTRVWFLSAAGRAHEFYESVLSQAGETRFLVLEKDQVLALVEFPKAPRPIACEPEEPAAPASTG